MATKTRTEMGHRARKQVKSRSEKVKAEVIFNAVAARNGVTEERVERLYAELRSFKTVALELGVAYKWLASWVNRKCRRPWLLKIRAQKREVSKQLRRNRHKRTTQRSRARQRQGEAVAKAAPTEVKPDAPRYGSVDALRQALTELGE